MKNKLRSLIWKPKDRTKKQVAYNIDCTKGSSANFAINIKRI